MKERQSSICPTCKREFKEIKDYPKVFVASVSVITTDDVPGEIPHWYKEDLLEVPKRGWDRKLVPGEVFDYFRTHPLEDKLVHSDNFIYHRPFRQTEEYRRQKEAHPEKYDGSIKWAGIDRFERQFNYAPAIKALLEQNVPLKKYLESLQQMVGKETSIRKIFPKWPQYLFPGVFQIPSRLGMPYADSPRLLLKFSKEKNAGGYRVNEIGIWGDGPNMGSAGGPSINEILPIGKLKYEGRINKI